MHVAQNDKQNESPTDILKKQKLTPSSPLVRGSVDSDGSEPIEIGPRRLSTISSPSLRSASGRRFSLSKSIGSFVGSYEESILSGRMSSIPSKPLVFTAQIGVIGRGKCKSSLRCPPHLLVSFPAYFYSDISPYVGQIDIDSAQSKRGYRIPGAGQLQIIIRNPNKTAIKLFLIPYELSDMPPLTKTFLRQKHYEGNTLRYAIHLQICCTVPGKYYIYKSQRCVFADRVMDVGGDGCRVTTQAPDQRYTPWVPEKSVREDVHVRPDAKEATFLGGSLLEVGIDEEEADGNRTPRSHVGMAGAGIAGGADTKHGEIKLKTLPRFDVRRSSYLERGKGTDGILAERLKALHTDT